MQVILQESHALFRHTSSHVNYLGNAASAAGTLSKVQLNVLARTQILEVLFFITFPHAAAMLSITGFLLFPADFLLLYL